MVIFNKIKINLNWIPDIAFYTTWIILIVHSYMTSISILLTSKMPKYLLDVTMENSWFVLNLNWVMKEVVLVVGFITAIYKAFNIIKREYRKFRARKKPPKSDGHSEDGGE